MAFAITVSILALADYVILGVRERRLDIGILRAIGWTPGHIAGSFVLETVFTALLGALAGWGTVIGFARVFYPAGVFTALKLGLALLPGAVVLAVAASLLPAWTAMKRLSASSLAQE